VTIVYRHPLPVRLFHWINAISFVLLLMSGLQIFNAHPRLYWGDVGYQGMPAVFEITGTGTLADPTSWVQIGSLRLYTTGFLGIPHDAPFIGVTNWAFPTWMTLPSAVLDLGRGRGWHFLMIWIFAANLGGYLVYGLASGRFKRELLPRLAQLRPAAILQDVWMHLRLRRATGEEARQYNLLQRLAYGVVIFFLLPIQVLSGMTMSNSGVAIFPWLIDLFGGRQTARTVHFIAAMLLVLFVGVHLFQVVVSGIANEVRSMITGYFVIAPPVEKK
jgi:thiosulfate reductase cytochrome b subunit